MEIPSDPPTPLVHMLRDLGAVEPVWIASQGLFLQLTPNKDFSNKVLIVMWCLSFEAAMVYAGLNRYHFIRN